MMNTELIAKAETFLKDTFTASEYLQSKPAMMEYQLAHAYRVANIAREISEADDNEYCDPTLAVIACLLHDIAHCEEMVTTADKMNRGRRGAEIVRPFLEELGLPSDSVNDICYGIAIHVDDESSFEWYPSPISDIVGEADRIDHFSTARIHASYDVLQFSKRPLSEKKKKVADMLMQLEQLRKTKSGTGMTHKLWRQRLDVHIAFFKMMEEELANSCGIL